jgi:hypothetical protein
VIDQKQIPPEVVEAAARATWDTQREHWGLYRVMLETEGHLPPYEELGRGKQRELLVEARAAIAAALNAWPNAKTLRDDGRRQTYIVPALILPLTTEARDE